MKSRKNFIYSKFFIYLVFVLSFLTIYAIISQFFTPSKSKFRFLEEEDPMEDLCKQSQNIYDYYYDGKEYNFHESNFDINDSRSNLIIEFIENDYETKYIFKYIWHTGVYVFFVVLLIAIVIMTIYYSFASCVKMCKEDCFDCFSCSFCKNKTFKKTSCILIPIIYLIVFVLAVISGVLAFICFDNFSGVVCVGVKFVESFVLGEKRNSIQKWAGISLVSSLLEQLESLTKTNEEQVKNINNNKTSYLNSWSEWDEYKNISLKKNLGKYFDVISPKMNLDESEEKQYSITPNYTYKWNEILNEIYEYDEAEASEIEDIFAIITKYLYALLGCETDETLRMTCKEQSTISQFFKSAKDIVLGVNNTISTIETSIIDPIKNIYDNVNNIIFKIYGVVVIFVIIYCILIEVLLGIFCCSKNCKCCNKFVKCILCFIYYTSIFIIIISFILGIAFGFLGSLISDGAYAVQNIASSTNLLAVEPRIFGKNGFTRYLDICLNDEGNWAEKLGLIDSFEDINNITDISDKTEEYINIYNKSESPLINHYYDVIQGLNLTYLNIQYYDIKANSLFNISDRIEEINNYVSGEYASEKLESCKINESWYTNKTKEGYEYNENYPEPSQNSRYLIYLYENDLYNKVNFANRYDNAFPTNERPYTSVSEASQKFSDFFKLIKENIISDKFIGNYLEDLKEMNRLYEIKNDYLKKALNAAKDPIQKFVQVYKDYSLGKNNIFSYLNCKFIGDNKNILLDVLYYDIGFSLNHFGLITCLFSLFMFIGIIFILIVIKNTKFDEKNGAANMDLETINDILLGKDLEKEIKSGDLINQELVNLNE